MDILILEEVGWGHSKMAVVTVAVLEKLNLSHKMNIIGNPLKFEDYGVSNPPALLINNKIAVEGYIPGYEEIKSILEKV